MKNTKLIFFLLLPCLTFSQTSIEVTLNPIRKEITENTKKQKVRVNKEYQLKIKGVNSAYTKSSIKVNSYKLSNPIPKILIPIFPGIDESGDFYGDKFASFFMEFELIELDSDLQSLSTYFREAKKKYEDLDYLKVISDSLYRNTKNCPNNRLANQHLDWIQDRWGETEKIALRKMVILHQHYILGVAQMYEKQIEKSFTDYLDTKKDYLNQHSELQIMKNSIITRTYLFYLEALFKSTKSVAFVSSNPFKAKKDYLEAKAILYDVYMKDTLLNEKIPFFTRGSITLDFTSGFFFNPLVESSYFLGARDSLTKTVNEQDGTSSIDVSFGAMGSFSYQFSEEIRAGLGIGAAISPLDGKTRFMGGANILFGRRKQVGISFGAMVAKLKVLSDQIQADGQGMYVPISNEAVPTYEKNEIGWYFGIIYNLTSKKKS